MENFLTHPAIVFMGLFAIMNPIANVPIFLSLTAADDRETTKAVALRAILLAFLIVSLFCVAGNLILELFGITMPAFRITGGLIAFLIGFHMLKGNQTSLHQLKEEDNRKCRESALSIAVTPLAMPILAGPGTIATAMNFATKGGMLEMVITIVVFAVLCLITYMLFIIGEKFVKIIGVGALGVITRMMGLILAVIGTQMIIEGVQHVLKSI